MNTRTDYLGDTYLDESEATFLEFRENERGKAVILDGSIFYPQGGGQPCDVGKISSDNGVFLVHDVRMDELGTIYHFGEFERGGFKKDEVVRLEIDKDRRVLNARLHSAGHLLDVVVAKMGLDQLVPQKGYHFPEGPYIEYEGELEDAQQYLADIEKVVNELIAEDLEMEREDLSYEEAKLRGLYAPAGKLVRVVKVKGYEGCGCGGTHVNRTSEIGKISVRKVSSKKGCTRIAYAVEN